MKRIITLLLILGLLSTLACCAEDYSYLLKTYFSDPTCDYVFEIPDYWDLAYADDYEEACMAIFETNKNDGSEIYYISLDLYSYFTEALGQEVYTREEINASMFPLSDLAQYIGIPEGDLCIITRNGKDYLKGVTEVPVDDPNSSDMYSAELYFLVENGYALGFMLSTLPTVEDYNLSWYRSELETMYTSLHYQERSNYDKLLAKIYDEYYG